MTYNIVVNGIVQSTGTYQLTQRTCIHDMNQKLLRDFSAVSDTDMMIENISGSSLELSDESYDGLGMYFRRGQ